MFEAIINASRLQSFVDSVTAIVDEATIDLNDDGWHCSAVDPANVAMFWIDVELPAFEHYESSGGQIGLNFNRFDDVIDVANSEDVVHLELDEERRILEIRIRGMRYELALIDPDAIRARPDLPDIDDRLSATYELRGAQVAEAVDTADLCSDHISMHAEAGDIEPVVRFHADGDTDSVDWEFREEDFSYVDIPRDEESLYSLEYVKDLVKPIPNSAAVTFSLGTEFPVKWTYEADDGIEVLNMLAPRIESG